MLDINERLKQQNNGEAWTDCNQRERSHHWVFEFTGEAGSWYRCKRCPVATVTNVRDSRGVRAIPAPFLR